MNLQPTVSRRAILSATAGAVIVAGTGVVLRRATAASEILADNSLVASSHAAMGAPLEISLEPAAQAIRPQLVHTFRRIEQALSAFRPDSELYRVNQSASLDWAPSSSLFHDVLEASVLAHQQTGGAFDPTVGPLLEAWGFRNQPSIPAPQALRHAKERVGLPLLRRRDHLVGFQKDHMNLDFGGIAVGFAIDQAFDQARAGGVRHGLINAAGDIRAIGSRPDGTPWTIGLRDPSDTDRVFATVRLPANFAMTTSGTYQKFVATREGKVSHIFDPRTGQSPREVVSASVLAPRAVLADALATASIVLGAEEALAMLERAPDTEGLLVVDTGTGRRCVGTSGLDVQMLRKV
jgi:thiamine biosynthesis lipoprotein